MSHDRADLVEWDEQVLGHREGARILALVALACSLVSKLFGAMPHSDVSYVPFVIAVFVLPVWYASGRARSGWERHSAILLLAQAIVTYVPFVVFGGQWVGGVSGLLAGLVLLLVPGRTGWILYATLTIAELVLWSLVGLPYEPRTNAVLWLLVSFANQSLILFGLNRLADVVSELHANRDALAEMEVTRQRLAATRHLRQTVQERLVRATALFESALATSSPEVARRAVLDGGQTARDAAADARRLDLDLPEPAPRDPRTTVTVEPRLAHGITVAVLVLFAVQFVANVCLPVAKERPGWFVTLLAVLVAAAVVVLQLRHTRAAGGDRLADWPWTLLALVALCLVFYPMSGSSSLGMLAFVAASSLLLIGHWSRWLLFAAVVLALPVLALLDPAPEPRTVGETITWSVYASATVAATSLLVFGLARLTHTAGQLRGVQEQVAGAARSRERLRLARDAHDLLGLGLSTIALKTDLAAALAEQDPKRARQEVVQALHLTRLVATDVEAVSGDRATLTFATEVATARRSLEAAGVHTEVDLDAAAGNVDPLAAVLREAVTNVLRHSRAAHCRIRLIRTGTMTELVVTNDGIAQVSGGEPGRGLTNMSERLQSLRGSLTTRIEGQEFTVMAMVPAPLDVEARDVVSAVRT